MKKKVACLVLAASMIFGQVITTYADYEDDLINEVEYTTSALYAQYDKIDNLYYQKQALEEEIAALDENLVSIMVSIDVLKNDITSKEAEISQTEVDLQKAEAAKEQQYEAMKERIQYLYEKGGNAAWFQMMVSAENISELLTKAEYTQQMYQYDRDALEDYSNTISQVQALNAQYTQEKSELESMEQELEAESEALQVEISNKQAESENCDYEIEYAYSLAAEYEEIIVNTQAEIEQIEAEKAAAAAEAEKEAEEAAAAEEAEASDETDEADGEDESDEEDSSEEMQYTFYDEDGDEISLETAKAAGLDFVTDEDGDSVSVDALLGDTSDEENDSDEEDGDSEETDSSDEDDDDSETTTSSSSSSSSSSGSSVVDYALQFVGNPYVWGGTSLTNGADCSGFVQSVYASFGVSLPRTSYEQATVGTEVSASDIQAGDIVCYGGHVAIYIGDGKIVHASSSTTGIIVSDNYAYRDIVSIRRVL